MQDNTQLVEVDVGDMVALLVDKYSERPQIARVREVKEESIRVEWYDGMWTGRWKLYKYRVGKKSVVWEEEVNRKCIVCKSVTLTKDNQLHTTTRKELKTLYR